MINKATCWSFLCYIFSEVVTKVTYTIKVNDVELSTDNAETSKNSKKLHLKEYNGEAKKMELKVQKKVSVFLLVTNCADAFLYSYEVERRHAPLKKMKKLVWSNHKTRY
jgi:hypothetical protein